MSLGLLNAAMLLGLLGAAVPVVIHLLHRHRDQVVEWGAMQFLLPGHKARRSIRLNELLVLAARMALLAVVAVALARPFWKGATAEGNAAAGAAMLGGDAPPRDVVIVLDGSESMDRKAGGATPRAQAVRWAREFLKKLRPGDSVAVLAAGDRVRGLVDPPSFDLAKVDTALAGVKGSRGSSDLPAALAEAFRILEKTQNPGREVVVLSDGQRSAWRPGEASRWALVRDLQGRLPVPPRVWAMNFGAGVASDAANGRVGPLSVSRSLVAPGLPIKVSTALTNVGPGPLTRTAELVIDGQAVSGSAQAVGPIPEGGKAPVTFRTALHASGAHLLTVRLVGGDDALPGDDASSLPVEVTAALPVLLVNGEPGLEPFSGETDFLRAALAPTGDDTPQVKATVVSTDRLNGESFKGQRVVVLANVERLGAEVTAALGRFLEAGGGVLVAPGDRADDSFYNAQGWIPAKLGDLKSDPDQKKPLAHPAPATFTGPIMTPFAQGDAPALAEADFFAFRGLAPVAGASVIARLDNGDPWVVERSSGKARVLLLATPLDAEVGTLPVSPDFVPLVHEWIFHLAGGATGPQRIHPGEPLVFDVELPANAALKTLPLLTPGGTTVNAPLVRASGTARVRFDETSEPGVYRLSLPEPPGAMAYAVVGDDERETDPAFLEAAEAKRLAEGWPLKFAADPAQLTGNLLAAERGGRHEIWRLLILGALGNLCVEVYLTRRLVRSQGVG